MHYDAEFRREGAPSGTDPPPSTEPLVAIRCPSIVALVTMTGVHCFILERDL
jgi:hypothetical protein